MLGFKKALIAILAYFLGHSIHFLMFRFIPNIFGIGGFFITLVLSETTRFNVQIAKL